MKKLLAIPFLLSAILSFAATSFTIKLPTPDIAIVIVNGVAIVADDGDDCHINIYIYTDDYNGSIRHSLCGD